GNGDVTSILTYLGSPLGAYHLRSLEEKANENWRVEFACHATPPYIRVYKMAACIHSRRFLLRSRNTSISSAIQGCGRRDV
ncbi:hypothetical protein M9458_005299, partial [Cirrhinus mrigala]